MSNILPTKCETRCAGTSHIISQILIIITSVLHFPVYNAYYVNSEKDVIELHNILSKPAHVAELQSMCILLWISFPLALISIYGFKRVLFPMVQGTSAQLVVYVLEKSYILSALFFILIPAVLLSVVSYDWRFDESGTVPAGYYIQLCLTVLELEIADCLLYANSTFVILVLLVIRFIIWKSSNPQNETYQQMYNLLRPQCIARLPFCTSALLNCGREFVFIGIPTVVFIVISVILCSFAKTGLFSFDSFLKYSIIIIFLINICFGVALVWLSYGNKLRMLDKILRDRQTEMFLEETNTNVGVNQLQLETRHPNKPDTPYTPLQSENNADFPTTS